jgi:alanine-glyoxylate transaminase/serine-glyoxylate transaminase/serine-pyruvate transaminase
MAGWQFIQSPGPTNIPRAVSAALARPAVDFASPGFAALLDGCVADLGGLLELDPDGQLYLHTATGHGAWEAALVNLFEPGEVVLAPDGGRFSAAWGRMAADLGLEVQWLPTDWTRALPPERLVDALTADRRQRISGVLLTHTETSTGITNDLPTLVRAIRACDHRALAVVDAIASFGTTPLRCAPWGVDAAVSASQKGLMLTPGLSFVAAGPRAVERAEQVRHPRSYWAWSGRNGADTYRRFGGTPPVQMVFALRAALDLLAAEGFASVLARHRRLALMVRAAVAHWSGGGALAFHAAEEAERADSVTCVQILGGHGDPVELRRCLRDSWEVAIGGGLDRLAADTFRIGHMGALNETMVLGVLAAVEGALAQCAIPHTEGGVTAALRRLRSLPADTAGPRTATAAEDR